MKNSTKAKRVPRLKRFSFRGALSQDLKFLPILSSIMLLAAALLLYFPIKTTMADTVIIDSGSDGGSFEYKKGIVNGIRRVIDMAWTPDGRILVAGKEGEIYIFGDGNLENTKAKELIYNVNPCTEQERALLSIAVR